MSAGFHGYDEKRFPLTAAQGRVLYHIERLFRSTGAGMLAHQQYTRACADLGLDVRRVQDWTTEQCVHALRIMERVARAARGFAFRDCATGWADFAVTAHRARFPRITQAWQDSSAD